MYNETPMVRREGGSPQVAVEVVNDRGESRVPTTHTTKSELGGPSKTLRSHPPNDNHHTLRENSCYPA